MSDWKRDRRTTTARGYGWQWQKFRRVWLSRHPLCGDREGGSSNEHSLCVSSGRVVAATVVDHIVPHRDDDDLKFDAGNLQSLCKECHDRKTAREDGGFVSTDARRFVVVGPPGCGKTTWVGKRARPGDLVFDLDAIATTMAQMPHYPRPIHVLSAMLALRRGFVEWLAGASPAVSAYIIVANKDEGRRIATRVKAKLVEVYRRSEEQPLVGGAKSLE